MMLDIETLRRNLATASEGPWTSSSIGGLERRVHSDRLFISAEGARQPWTDFAWVWTPRDFARDTSRANAALVVAAPATARAYLALYEASRMVDSLRQVADNEALATIDHIITEGLKG